MTTEMAATDRLVGDYLELLKRSVSGLTLGVVRYHRPVPGPRGWKFQLLKRFLENRYHWELAVSSVFDAATNVEGQTWVAELPPGVVTMVGRARLDNLHVCVRNVVRDNVPGDLIEAGVWRGGASIFIKGALRAFGDTMRSVYVADSFEGLPPPDLTADSTTDLHLQPELAVGVEEVKANFDRYGFLDDRVHFVKGWFRDTLPGLRDKRWSLIRLDGDLYESTMDGLTNLYPGLEPGGYLIIDDYYNEAGCRQAVHEYRDAHGINETIETIDWGGVYWRRDR